MDEFDFRRYARIDSSQYDIDSPRRRQGVRSNYFIEPETVFSRPGVAQFVDRRGATSPRVDDSQFYQLQQRQLLKENLDMRSEVTYLKKRLQTLNDAEAANAYERKTENFATRYQERLADDVDHFSNLYSKKSVRKMGQDVAGQERELELMKQDALETAKELRKVDKKIKAVQQSDVLSAVARQKERIRELKAALSDALNKHRLLKADYLFVRSGVDNSKDPKYDPEALSEDLRLKKQVLKDTQRRYDKILERHEEELEVFNAAAPYFERRQPTKERYLPEEPAVPRQAFTASAPLRSPRVHPRLSFTNDEDVEDETFEAPTVKSARVTKREVPREKAQPKRVAAPTTGTSISVGLFTRHISRSELVSMFEKFGKIKDAEVFPKTSVYPVKYYGSVRFLQSYSARKALSKMNGTEFEGDTLCVKWATNQRWKPNPLPLVTSDARRVVKLEPSAAVGIDIVGDASGASVAKTRGMEHKQEELIRKSESSSHAKKTESSHEKVEVVDDFDDFESSSSSSKKSVQEDVFEESKKASSSEKEKHSEDVAIRAMPEESLSSSKPKSVHSDNEKKPCDEGLEDVNLKSDSSSSSTKGDAGETHEIEQDDFEELNVDSSSSSSKHEAAEHVSAKAESSSSSDKESEKAVERKPDGDDFEEVKIVSDASKHESETKKSSGHEVKVESSSSSSSEKKDVERTPEGEGFDEVKVESSSSSSSKHESAPKEAKEDVKVGSSSSSSDGEKKQESEKAVERAPQVDVVEEVKVESSSSSSSKHESAAKEAKASDHSGDVKVESSSSSSDAEKKVEQKASDSSLKEIAIESSSSSSKNEGAAKEPKLSDEEKVVAAKSSSSSSDKESEKAVERAPQVDVVEEVKVESSSSSSSKHASSPNETKSSDHAKEDVKAESSSSSSDAEKKESEKKVEQKSSESSLKEIAIESSSSGSKRDAQEHHSADKKSSSSSSSWKAKPEEKKDEFQVVSSSSSSSKPKGSAHHSESQPKATDEGLEDVNLASSSSSDHEGPKPEPAHESSSSKHEVATLQPLELNVEKILPADEGGVKDRAMQNEPESKPDEKKQESSSSSGFFELNVDDDKDEPKETKKGSSSISDVVEVLESSSSSSEKPNETPAEARSPAPQPELKEQESDHDKDATSRDVKLAPLPAPITDVGNSIIASVNAEKKDEADAAPVQQEPPKLAPLSVEVGKDHHSDADKKAEVEVVKVESSSSSSSDHEEKKEEQGAAPEKLTPLTVEVAKEHQSDAEKKTEAEVVKAETSSSSSSDHEAKKDQEPAKPSEKHSSDSEPKKASEEEKKPTLEPVVRTVAEQPAEKAPSTEQDVKALSSSSGSIIEIAADESDGKDKPDTKAEENDVVEVFESSSSSSESSSSKDKKPSDKEEPKKEEPGSEPKKEEPAEDAKKEEPVPEPKKEVDAPLNFGDLPPIEKPAEASPRTRGFAFGLRGLITNQQSPEPAKQEPASEVQTSGPASPSNYSSMFNKPEAPAPPLSPIRPNDAKRSESDASKIDDVQVLSQSESSANAQANITMLSEDYSSSSPRGSREKSADQKPAQAPEKSERTGVDPIEGLSDISAKDQTNHPSSLGMISVKTEDSIRDAPLDAPKPPPTESQQPAKKDSDEADVNIDVSDSSSCDF